MHLKSSRLLALVAGSALSVIPSPRPAQAADTCAPGDLYADVQPAFTAAGFDQLQQLTLTPQRTLRSVNPFWTPTSVDSIVFPSDQNVVISYVYESSAASHALGYLYMSDLRARGYVNAQGDLVDANGNGIADLHEDLYNLAPPSGVQARPYIGVSPRCANTFSSRGFTYRQPDLALNAACAPAFVTHYDMTDARPGRTSSAYNIIVDVIGSNPTTTTSTGYSDNGLHPRIPNLLEPAHASNGNLGLGHLAFLLTDDDSDTSTHLGLGAVSDAVALYDGIPDYDVSAHDGHGRPRTSNPDPGITAYDRTVDLGVIPGGQEVVFFLVSAYTPSHNVDNDQVYPCLRRDAALQCMLHLRTPINVFFSKAKWNLDQDFRGQTPVTSRAMGCQYNDACNIDNPASSAYACRLADNPTQKLCGWLDYDALGRLGTVPYGSTSLPMAATTAVAPGNLVMPHALLGNVGPTSDRWLLAFEDLPGGGDRDYNDAVFMLRNWAATPGLARSAVLSPDAPGCAIKQVYLHKDDAQAPTCAPPGAITYSVATDCRTCLAGTCIPNPTPTWHPVTFDWNRDAVLNVSGTPGHQLCWKADLAPGGGQCQASVNNVDIGYEAGPRNP
ncbi:DUF4114 domain-containing protein [Corallococcus aberystwythensis]|uniref:DUF4114 domain-containing protein n=1 Tax=Corallococcus aberystwythensis TaxID=2316722 RepID=A0A3A8PK68_9BACT|nr:DUF4114 domain-containing protein [Corallococcus aberystwythensis]RKH56756.1 DUF4114 domain-containing protein [Corallococcus aberystwythensis]